MKRIIALCLATALGLPAVLSGCSSKGNGDSETPQNTPEVTAGVPSAEAAAGDAEETEIELGLEEQTFGGYTFHIYQHYVSNGCHLDFMSEDITGEPINDADYERRSYTEEQCDVKIEPVRNDVDAWNGHKGLEVAVQAGTNDYDLAGVSSYSAANSLVGGILKDLNTVGNLDLDKPWWDPYCKEECTFGKSVYFMTGDLSINDNRATYCIYFNKNLAEQYQLPNFYDEVKNHNWTIDRFRSFAEALPTDLDTDDDGKHVNDTDDAYAIWIWDDIMMGIVNASGVKCATIQQDGSLTLTLNCEQLYNTFDKFAAYAFDTGITCEYQRSGYDQEYGQIGFREGRALFLMSYLYDATALRDMEDDFGILPMMLYDETQDRYCNSVSSYPSSFYVIPICSFSEEEYDRTGYVTQMLAYKSLMTMTPAYYEQTLQGKVSRDEESSSMLDLIFATRSYDFGWYFEIGGYTGVMMDALRNYDLNLASNIKAYEKMASKVLDKYNKKIAELGN